MKKVLSVHVLNWHGSDHGIDELAQVVADLVNGEYDIELAKREILDMDDGEEEEYFYYEVHVFQNRHEGYGIPVKSETKLNEEEVIKLAISLKVLTEKEAGMVDEVHTLTEGEYLEMM